jgi:uncharacterized membrane protein YidH (DUF202 family)
MARGVGIVLILLGLAGLAWGGFNWNQKKNVEFGPLDLQVTEKHTLPIPPIAGAVAVVAGLALVFVAGTRRNEN